MEFFQIFATIVSFLALSGAVDIIDGTPTQDIIVLDNGIKTVTQNEATDVYNAVNNVLAGREDPEIVKKMILTEYKGTQRDSIYSQDEIEYNTRYQAFLNEAYTVLQVYEAGQTPDLSNMKEAMNTLN